MTAHTVCAVIITYNPRPTFVDNIVNVAAQVNHVVIVDNGSCCGTEPYLQQLETHLDCKVIRNPQNLGIAHALNLGIKHALETGYHWVCTFDQDSQVCDGFVSTMFQAYTSAPNPEKIALIAPSYVDRKSGTEMRLKQARNGQILTAMTSGSMVPLTAIRKLGLFDESLYMDAVDIEFCLRARREGMLILQSPAVLVHSLGETSYYQLFGLRFGVTNHRASRRYYMTRNRLRLLMRYATDWPWIWRESRTMLLDAVKILLAEDNKYRKFRAMASGIADACRGKLGKQIEL